MVVGGGKGRGRCGIPLMASPGETRTVSRDQNIRKQTGRCTWEQHIEETGSKEKILAQKTKQR